MGPHFSQAEFFDAWRSQVGFTRPGGCPYSRIMAMNSGSEAVELSARLTDTHAKLMTNPGAPHAGRRSTMLVLEGSFYGRTYRPARLSHSCREIYKSHLASFQHAECHLPITVPPNDVGALRAAFAKAEAENLHIEAMYMCVRALGRRRRGVCARSRSRRGGSRDDVCPVRACVRAPGSP
jgi:4-aminobutyrate aminotransferase-like enzyme